MNSPDLIFSVEHPAIVGHFPGHPQIPAALLVDRWQRLSLPSEASAWRALRKVRFPAPGLPDQPIRSEFTPGAADTARFALRQGDQLLCSGVQASGESPEPQSRQVVASEQLISAQHAYQKLPHSGAICLLETLSAADDQRLVGSAHLHNANPLLKQDTLSGWCGLEYAAQLLACHGALQQGAIQRAQVVMAREWHASAELIPAKGQQLWVEVDVIWRQSESVTAGFRFYVEEQLFGGGEFTVMHGTA